MNVTFSYVLQRFYFRAFHSIWDWKLTNIWRMPLSTRQYLFVSRTYSIRKIIHYGKSWLKVGLFSHLIKIQHYTESIVQYFCITHINCRQKTNCSVALASYSPFLSSDYKICWRTISIVLQHRFGWVRDAVLWLAECYQRWQPEETWEWKGFYCGFYCGFSSTAVLGWRLCHCLFMP